MPSSRHQAPSGCIDKLDCCCRSSAEPIQGSTLGSPDNSIIPMIHWEGGLPVHSPRQALSSSIMHRSLNNDFDEPHKTSSNGGGQRLNASRFCSRHNRRKTLWQVPAEGEGASRQRLVVVLWASASPMGLISSGTSTAVEVRLRKGKDPIFAASWQAPLPSQCWSLTAVILCPASAQTSTALPLKAPPDALAAAALSSGRELRAG